jgi:hypothetical protein
VSWDKASAQPDGVPAGCERLHSAKNLHYGLDFCPAFWDWLIANNTAGVVLSIEKVGDEVLAGADELSDWGPRRGAMGSS